MKFYINGNGISDNDDINNKPDRIEVDFCKKILSLITESKNFKDTSSYGLKHTIEKYREIPYVSNGALIQAVMELDMSIKRSSSDSPNAFFKFDYHDIHFALLSENIKSHKPLFSTSTLTKIKKDLEFSKIKGSKTKLNDLIYIYKDYGISINILDILILISDSWHLNVKYDFADTENINSVRLGNNIFINVSKNKIRNILKRKTDFIYN